MFEVVDDVDAVDDPLLSFPFLSSRPFDEAVEVAKVVATAAAAELDELDDDFDDFDERFG
jgi:hypothetical protein